MRPTKLVSNFSVLTHPEFNVSVSPKTIDRESLAQGESEQLGRPHLTSLSALQIGFPVLSVLRNINY